MSVMAKERKKAEPPKGEPVQPPEPAGEKKKPNRTGTPINVWVSDDLFNALDAFMAAQRVRPKLTDTVELALQEFLTREKFWPPKAK